MCQQSLQRKCHSSCILLCRQHRHFQCTRHHRCTTRNRPSFCTNNNSHNSNSNSHNNSCRHKCHFSNHTCSTPNSFCSQCNNRLSSSLCISKLHNHLRRNLRCSNLRSNLNHLRNNNNTTCNNKSNSNNTTLNNNYNSNCIRHTPTINSNSNRCSSSIISSLAISCCQCRSQQQGLRGRRSGSGSGRLRRRFSPASEPGLSRCSDSTLHQPPRFLTRRRHLPCRLRPRPSRQERKPLSHLRKLQPRTLEPSLAVLGTSS
mmetsp:Transcript_51528/g.92822  ORF Transcript_51528/g.92822 Transcript_51528/m.92822 type:complete len:259 (-) Transcript_51528:457-1233(-)